MADREGLFQTIVEAAPHGVIVTDERGLIVLVNARVESWFGYAREELVGQRIELLFPERARRVHANHRAAFLEHPSSRPMGAGRDLFGLRKDGTEFPLEIGLNPVATAAGRFVVAAVADITTRKDAELALVRSNERFSQIADNIREVFFIVDAQFRETLYVNPAYETVWGRSRDPLMADPGAFMEAVLPEDREALGRAIARAQQGETNETEFRIARPDGEVRWILAHTTPIRDAEGRVYRLAGSALDITQRARLERQFHHAQKMEAVGRLAGGIAHDFNNVLTVISGHTELLKTGFPAGDERLEDLDAIARAATSAASLTRQLLAFARREVVRPVVLDLNEAIGNTERLLRRVIGEDVELVTVPAAAPARATIDPGQLEQVLMNLSVNARDAMPGGGRLTIEVTLVDVTDDSPAAGSAGPHVMLAVSDTGAGMDRETQQRIFEPFFTTKESGKGTGLGLATVYGIVQQSRGRVWVYSEPGHGTTFKIYLPRADAEVTPVAAPLAASAQGSETVLLVEDADDLRRVARRGLEGHGYHVLEAAGARAALTVVAEWPDPIHLLVTDVVMPEVSGRELADRLVAIRPGLKVLYMSGYTDDAVVRAGLLAGDIQYLQKPFTPDGLARKVREALDRTAEAES